jgi:hypothetical protein
MVALAAMLVAASFASAQTQTVKVCLPVTSTASGIAVQSCQDIANANPLPVTATFAPSGTQDVNLKQILGAAPSLTNPLWVAPATGAVFPVTTTGTGANNADGVAGVSTGLGQNTAYPFLWNGTTFDRWYGDKTNGAWVNVKSAVALAVTGAFWQATQPVSATTLPLPTGAATSALQQQNSDPCAVGAKSFAPFSITASGASVITASGSTSTYVCGIAVGASTATSFSLVSGTGSSVCTGGTPAPVFGNSGETAANGFPIAGTTGGGLTFGNGAGTIAKSGASQNTCIVIVTTNSPTVAGQIAFIQQ